jgi:hypothetical protein
MNKRGKECEKRERERKKERMKDLEKG